MKCIMGIFCVFLMFTNYVYGAKFLNCFNIFLKLVKVESQVQLSTEELETLQAWAAWNMIKKSTVLGPSMKYETKQAAYLLLSELPTNILEKLFTHPDGTTVSREELDKRLRKLGIELYRVPAFVFIEDYYFHPLDGYASLKQKIRETSSFPDKYKELLRASWKRGIDKHEIATMLADKMTREYKILIRSKNIVLPDGAVYPIVKRLWRGGLVIKIPREKASGFDMGQHLKDYMSSTYHMVKGRFTPDGRFMVNSPYDWANALTGLGNDVKVTIYPDKDGNFHTYTHYEILRLFYPYWFDEFMDSVCDQGCEVIKEKVELSPYEFIRPYYYEVLRLPKPKDTD